MNESDFEKSKQTIYERAEIGEKAVFELRSILKGKKLDVLGHIDSTAYCCRNGTVAIVKVDLDSLPSVKMKSPVRKKT